MGVFLSWLEEKKFHLPLSRNITTPTKVEQVHRTQERLKYRKKMINQTFIHG